MQLERPRFRQDLVAEPIEDGNSKFIDVMDPDSGNVFRFYEVEYSLACAMDGERDVPGIMRWAQEELGLSASASEVKTVIATLGELGYLDGAAARPETPAPATKPSIWDPPAPAVQDDMLGRGVVVGQKRHNTPVPDMELGNAGASAPSANVPATPAANIELGAGVTTGRSSPKPKAEDIALGVPGRADVSVDLSDQVAVSPKDVKEAVRASKVMNAVEIPDELKSALGSAGRSESRREGGRGCEGRSCEVSRGSACSRCCEGRGCEGGNREGPSEDVAQAGRSVEATGSEGGDRTTCARDASEPRTRGPADHRRGRRSDVLRLQVRALDHRDRRGHAAGHAARATEASAAAAGGEREARGERADVGEHHAGRGGHDRDDRGPR